jgi:glucose uptake protein GlcU
MWIPGALSGILWSAGNFMCIIAVTFLGQGVGYSFTQASMLISGLWGIFYFHEIGKDMITRWLASAVVALFGILWLSYEHAK